MNGRVCRNSFVSQTDGEETIDGLVKLAYENGFTLMLAQRYICVHAATKTRDGLSDICGCSPEEAAQHIQTYAAFESGPTAISPAICTAVRVAPQYFAQLAGVLTAITGINKCDAYMLASSFGVRACCVYEPLG